MTPPFPPRDDLLATLHEFIVAIRADLPPEKRYQAQVAAYLVEVLRREGEPAESVVGDLTAFREAIRSGALDGSEAELAETLFAEAVADVRRTRPDHLAPEDRA